MTVDLSTYIVSYNLVIGVLLVLASGRIAAFASALGGSVERFTRVAVNTFGYAVAVLSATILVAFHWLRIGL